MSAVKPAAPPRATGDHERRLTFAPPPAAPANLPGATRGSRLNRYVVSWSIVFLAFALVLVSQFVSLRADGASAQALSFPRNPAQPTEVVIIGTRHSAQLEYEDHAPARMRALLNRIDPAAVGVETPPAKFAEGVYYEIAYESYGVAVPWALEKGKEVRGIDWQAGGMEMIHALAWPDTGLVKESGTLPLELWDMRAMLFADTPEWRDAVHREYAYGTPEPSPWNEALRRYMLYRNVMIAREIVNLAADYDGQRIAVLIGAAHKPDLDLFLESVPNVVVRHASEWWGEGLTEEEVAAEERRPDLLAILWYNLAGGRVEPGDVDLARMDALLARLEAEMQASGQEDVEIRFLRAKRHAVAGASSKALEIYRQLVWEEWEDRPFTYPDRSLAQRIAEVNAREAEAIGLPGPNELSLGNVISPVGNLTIRQRLSYELAAQDADEEAQRRASTELESAGLSPKQLEQLRALLGWE